MPIINLNKKRVLKLIGKDVPDSELKEKISFLGTDLEEITKDEIVVEIFPNRPDLLSEEGFARALSSFIGIKKGLRNYDVKKSNYVVKITREVNYVRPFTSCAVIKNLKLDAEKIKDLINVQEKLHVTFGRNRKRCAIGVYPMEVIKWPITYTALPPEKIKFIPLEEKKEMNGLQILSRHPTGRDYGHLLEGYDEFPVFIDANKDILSMPPIINSEKTGKISEKTREVFLECSGHDFLVVTKAVNMICAALADMGGDLYEVKLDYAGPKKHVSPSTEPEKMILPVYYVEKYLGFEITEQEIIDCLEKMGHSAQKVGHNIKVLIPFYRTDILHPIDLIEDVAIGYGYNNIKDDNKRVYTTGKEDYLEKVKRKLREIVSGLGLVEVSNFSLLNEEHQKKIYGSFDYIVKIKNSVSSEFNSMRLRMFPSLLNTLKNNRHNEYPQNIFEIGTVFKNNSSEETGVEERDVLGLVLCSENVDFTNAKQHLESLFDGLGLTFSIESSDSEFFIKGRSGKVVLDGKEIGEVGEMSPETLSVFNLEMPVVGFEIDLDKLIILLND